MVGSHAVNSQSAHSKTEDACAKCTASASQTCKTNTVRKEAQRMTGQDSQKRFLLLATCRRSKLAIAFFLFCFATPTHSPLQMSLVLAGNRMSQKCKKKKAAFNSFIFYLEDSTVQKPPAFSTSSPGLPPGFQGSCRGIHEQVCSAGCGGGGGCKLFS